MPRIARPLLAIALAGAAALPAAAQETRLDGFYLGIFGGIAVLDSTVVIPAAEGRAAAKFVDQGGDGAVIGLRGGWGRMISRHGYAGIEGEFLLPIDVTSRLNALGVEYRDRLRNEFGVYGRIGWSPERNSLFFLRAGMTIPRQSFDSVPGGSRETWSVAPAIGLGAETHVTRHVAARIDATYSWPTGDNRMESYRMTAGLAWRF
ncbi:outer membrane beta-barrel protein [Roseomonas sp. PWR1]|uniref:Outer membrane beta-barrel protein n=1 Tax=Roseomonas nitratireducens TaxID=2820810 RepID=A0ABS4AYQ1_9PROT|nr:outer membrane beta-barrel protein [Neoroseomonas nitratireducens]MBP0466502.1 outer membrane beta-barrel protein [Neoroseomonas nitratireducens]